MREESRKFEESKGIKQAPMEEAKEPSCPKLVLDAGAFIRKKPATEFLKDGETPEDVEFITT